MRLVPRWCFPLELLGRKAGKSRPQKCTLAPYLTISFEYRNTIWKDRRDFCIGKDYDGVNIDTMPLSSKLDCSLHNRITLVGPWSLLLGLQACTPYL